MPELIPACFRGGAAAARPPEEAAASAAAAAGPSLTTSVYETRLGLVSLSWSRTALGLSLLAELRLRDDGGNDDDDDDDDDDEPLAFRIRPWLFWKRRGSKRFHLGDHRRGGGGPRSVELAWDLTRARFPPGGAPEPAGGYFVAVAVDGEFVLVAGDLRGEAYRRTAARWSPRGEALLISRREHVTMRRDARSCAVRSYSTSALFGGKEREITITLTSKEKEKEKEKESKFKGKKFKGEDMAMSISVDGSRVLHVRRLRWKFRGCDTVDIDSSPIQISWDLHSWLFPPRRDPDAAPPPPPPPPPRAVFVFRFDREPTQSDPKTTTKYESQEKKRCTNFSSYGRGVVEEYLGKLSRRNWSDNNNNNNNNNNNERIRRRNKQQQKKKKKKSLLKTSSSSSTASSTASTMSGSTVMDWASAEETDMQRGEGFSLLVYALKS